MSPVAILVSFDRTDGGLSEALKFPHPAEMEFCLRSAVAYGDASLLELVKLTAARMAERGLYDQLGGGFYRYCVDQQWVIPHFEKMLYDNGPLLRLYSDMWLVERRPLYARVAADTATWVMREMQSPDGGYYSTLDADSEHVHLWMFNWSVHDRSLSLKLNRIAITVTSDDSAAVAQAGIKLQIGFRDVWSGESIGRGYAEFNILERGPNTMNESVLRWIFQ